MGSTFRTLSFLAGPCSSAAVMKLHGQGSLRKRLLGFTVSESESVAILAGHMGGMQARCWNSSLELMSQAGVGERGRGSSELGMACVWKPQTGDQAFKHGDHSHSNQHIPPPGSHTLVAVS